MVTGVEANNTFLGGTSKFYLEVELVDTGLDITSNICHVYGEYLSENDRYSVPKNIV